MTSASLLGRLRSAPGDGDWSDFHARYAPLIRSWCRRWGLQDADADDLAQDVLVRLAGKLRSFEYDPSKRFRAYVKTIAHYAWCDLIEARKRPGTGSGESAVLDRLGAVEARDDLQARLADAFDLELFEEASARVRLRVEPRTWEAFRLTTAGGLSGAEAGEAVGMAVAAVFKAKSKVQQMLRDEVARLEGGG